jgi:hypothetical protein
MEGQGLVGLEARLEDGAVLGRISDVVSDEESGEVTHVIVARDIVAPDEEEQLELPISALTLDPEADFATFHADPSDEEPGDHLGDEEAPEGYAPAQSDDEDYEHEGQFVTTPQDPSEAQSPEEADREADDEEVAERLGWEDEGSTTAESGYPRNDVYIDPDTGEEQIDSFMEDNETLKDDVEDLINGTDLEVRSIRDGVVALSGTVATQEDLNEVVAEIMGLDGVLDVDTTDVEIVDIG